jgi:Tol biopolymer transport system component
MSPERSIAHYRVTTKLGEGGMGAVWRATDTKLNRDVAIKILPDTFAADPDRLARFTREAQVVASLNHPNIAAIYGVEDRALILELVEGPTLAERIAQGAIPLDEVLPIARQIAEALEYAHDKGIVHRDLKPANIKLTVDGRAKILDFGLAKAFSTDFAAADPTSSPTMTMRATMAGLIMGTAGYMSPEQAKGKPVDRRADIWAFGVVLVEMLTGRMMYTGETVSETLASVIKDQPDLAALPAGTPPAIRRLLKRCLEKDPQRRLQAIGEARILIDEAGAPEEPAAPTATAAPVRRGAPWWLVATAVAIPTLILGAFLWRATRPVERPMQQFSVDMGPDALAASRVTAILSPDGTRVVYSARNGASATLATRRLEQSKPTLLAGTEGAFDPFFSPDGQWIGFFDTGKLKKISVQGGAAVTLCDAGGPRGAAWGEDGFIYGAFDGLRLSRVSAAGGQPEVLSDPARQGERTHRWPQILPGGESILMTSSAPGRPTYDDANISVFSIKSHQWKIVQRGGYFGRYTPTGHLLFVHNGTLFAVPFDLKRLETRGMPAPIIENLAANAAQASGQFDFAGNGTFVYLSGSMSGGSAPIVWLDKSGKKETILPAPAAHPLTPRLSPNGKLLAYSLSGDVYVYDPARGASSRITFDPTASSAYPVWSPDGKHLAFSPIGSLHGIWWVRSDGSGKPESIYDPGYNCIVMSISPDGKRLAYHQPGKGRDIYTLPLDLSDPDHPKAGRPEVFLDSPGTDVDPAFSPDGKWLAYASSESGDYQVFVRPFPEGAQGGGQAQISSVPGRFPVWSRTAKEIFYVSLDGRIMVTPYIVTGRAFSPGKPAAWSETPIGLTGVNIPLDLAPDGKRFVVFPGIETVAADKSTLHITFLLNFFDELKRRLP